MTPSGDPGLRSGPVNLPDDLVRSLGAALRARQTCQMTS